MNEVSETMDKSGFEAGYQLATEKLKEYPACDLLVCNLAMLLDGGLMFYGGKHESNEKYKEYKEKIESFYWRAAQSEDAAIQAQAKAHLISQYMQKEEYQKAQDLLNTLPLKSPVDREQAQANIYIAQGEFETAARLIEEKLLSAMNEIHAALMTLMEIALKEERISDAEYIANVDKQAAQLFDLWEYNSYVAHWQLYDATKNRAGFLKILFPMLKSLTKEWNINQSPLYRHIRKKEVGKTLGRKFQKAIMQSLDTEEETVFLKETPEFQTLINEIHPTAEEHYPG